MSVWPGDAYFGYRYDYAEEYVRVMRELWATGRSDFKGKHFQMDDCRLSPRPRDGGGVKVIAAGQSPRGVKFASEWADYNFCSGKGINTPTAFADANVRLVEATKETGRDVGAMVSFLFVCRAILSSAGKCTCTYSKLTRQNQGSLHDHHGRNR